MNNDKTKQHSPISTEQLPEINIPPSSDINLLLLSISTWQKLFQNNFEYTQNTFLNMIHLMPLFFSESQQQDFLVQTIKANAQRSQNAQEIINETIAKYNSKEDVTNDLVDAALPGLNIFNWWVNLIITKETIASGMTNAPFIMPTKLMP